MLSRSKQLRKTNRRRLGAELLEDRRLLAVVELTPSAGTVTQESGKKIVTVDPGATISVSARITESATPVQGFQLNFSNTSTSLGIKNFVNGDLAAFAVDTALDTTATPPDAFVSSAVQADLVVPPPRLMGSFDVIAPTAAGDYPLTLNFSTNANSATTISDRNGNALPITDFGDIVIRVAAAPAPSVAINLVPEAGVGTVTEEGGVTVITVAAGTDFSVETIVSNPGSTNLAVQGFQLNLQSSNAALVLNNFVNGDFAAFAVDTTLNSAATTPDYFVSSAVQTDLVVPPPRSLGTFDVKAPSAAGDYRLTTNFTANTTTGTTISNRNGGSFPITDFGDLIVRVVPQAGPTATLNLIPTATGGTVSEEGGVTVITVAPGTVVNMRTEVGNPNTTNIAVQGFQLNLQNSNPALLINGFTNGDFAAFAVDTTLNSAATPPDFFVSSAVQTDLVIPPPRNLGTFNVTAPAAPGDYRVTLNFTTNANTRTTLSTRDGGSFNISDFGDVIVRVSNATPPVPTVTFAAATRSVDENAGTVTLTVNLSAAATTAVTIPFTVTGTATSGTDFTVSASPITIAAGATTGSITLNVTDDTADEPNETVIVTLGTPTGATLGAIAAQTVTIVDNDPTVAQPTVAFAAATRSVNENDGTVTLTVNLSAAATTAVTVPFTVTGTATSGTDFTVSASPITIAAGATTGSITLNVTDDTTDEPNETVIVTLGTPTGATLGAIAAQTVTIVDNDPTVAQPTVAFAAATRSVNENAGTVTLTVNLSAAATTAVTVPFTVTGTATSGTDFTVSASPITIAAGATTGSITLNVIDDTTDEPDETVIVTLGTPTGATLGAIAAQTVTIVDNEPPVSVLPTVAFAAATRNVDEDAGTVTVTVTLSAASTTAVTVPFTVTGTARTGNDFTISASPITIAAGATTGTITLNVIDDAIAEINETVVVTLGTPTGATLGTIASQTITIRDDDGPADGENRIIIPGIVARPHVIPGDQLPTAILFKAIETTTLTVTQIGVASALEEVILLDGDRNPVGGRVAGVFTAQLAAGELYALIFQARSTESFFSIRSSAGPGALVGSQTNLLLPADVNADGQATAADALAVINRMNTLAGEGEQASGSSGLYHDVNGDGHVTAVDALSVINQLAVQSVPEDSVTYATAGSVSALESEETSNSTSNVDFAFSGEDDEDDVATIASGVSAHFGFENTLVIDLESADEASAAHVDDLLASDGFLNELLIS